MLDDDKVDIKNDFRIQIERVLKAGGYLASAEGLFNINRLMNRTQATWAEDEKERKKSSRAEDEETLDRLATTFQDFAAVWARMTRSTLARAFILDAVRTADAVSDQLKQIDEIVHSDATLAFFRSMKDRRISPTVAGSAPGNVPIDSLLPGIQKLLRALASELVATGNVPRATVPATHAKCCKIASELLAVCGVNLAPKTLQNRTRRA